MRALPPRVSLSWRSVSARKCLVLPEPRKGPPYAVPRATLRELLHLILVALALFFGVAGFPSKTEAAPSVTPAPTQSATPSGVAEIPTNTLESIAAICALEPSVARLALPAVVTGIVTYYEPKWDNLFVQDSTGGIYVFPGNTPRARSFKPGQLIRIRGRTLGNKPLNAIVEESVEELGSVPLPVPIRVTPSEVLAGLYNSHWIEFEAVVRRWVFRYQRLEVELAVGGRRILAHSPRNDGKVPPANFVHSRVRVRAVASQSSDASGNLLRNPRLRSRPRPVHHPQSTPPPTHSSFRTSAFRTSPAPPPMFPPTPAESSAAPSCSCRPMSWSSRISTPAWW